MELSIEDTLNNGIEAHKAGQIQKADNLYTNILNSNPMHPDANHNKGVLMASNGKEEEALPFFEKALKANFRVAQFWRSYIETLIKLDRFTKAKEVIAQARDMGGNGEGLDELEKWVEQQTLAVIYKPSVEQKSPSILDSAGVEKALRLAKKNAKEGKFVVAQKIYKDILNKYPNNKTAIKRHNALSKKAVSNIKNSKAPQKNTIDFLVDLKSQGKYQKLKSEVTSLLSSFPQSIALYDLLGTADYGLGNYQESVEAYKQALAWSPNSPVIHYNLGNSLKEQGNLKDAVISYEKALSLNSNSVEVFLNMARSFQDYGSHENAIIAYHKAISINPDITEAYIDMGVNLEIQGDLGKAIHAYHTAVLKDPSNIDANYKLAGILKNLQFEAANPSLQNTIKSILDKKTLVRPSDISHACLSLLKFEPVVKELTQQNHQGKFINNLEKIISDLSNLPLLLKLMSICPIADTELELGFTNIRSQILTSVLENSANTNILKFQSALALHCFTNEYVYNQTSDDSESIKKLENLVEVDLAKGNQPSPMALLCLASFKALGEFTWCALVDVTKHLEEVFIRQVLEPKEEECLKSEIKTLEVIKDGISSKVRKQYENNPYPRWVNLGLIKEPICIEEMVDGYKLKLTSPSIKKVRAPSILIAGCGTGQHSIGTASRFNNSKVTAIDLSLSSLAYAKRKTEELGIQNIEYIQADLLDLEKLNSKFDIIESMGVLHHMRDPLEGWKVLTKCLKSGGLMKIGLYSELARKPVVDFRKNIIPTKKPLSSKKILSIRKKILNSTKKEHKYMKSWRDFYSLSEIRDLLFHVQEHRFKLPQIKNCLNNLGLEFCGFDSLQIQNAFLRSYSDSDVYDLVKWDLFEKSNPRTFVGMYQFWCQKS